MCSTYSWTAQIIGNLDSRPCGSQATEPATYGRYWRSQPWPKRQHSLCCRQTFSGNSERSDTQNSGRQVMEPPTPEFRTMLLLQLPELPSWEGEEEQAPSS